MAENYAASDLTIDRLDGVARQRSALFHSGFDRDKFKENVSIFFILFWHFDAAKLEIE